MLDMIVGGSTQKLNQFQKKGIETIDDLVYFSPRKYIDLTNFKTVKTCEDLEIISIITIIKDIEKRDKNLIIKGIDQRNSYVTIFFFGKAFLKDEFRTGDSFVFCGTVKKDRPYQIMIANPVFYSKDTKNMPKMMPVYSKIQGMSDDYLLNSIKKAILLKDEYLEPEILNKFEISNVKEALKFLHLPENIKQIEAAKKRILFEKLFKLNLAMGLHKKDETMKTKFPIKDAQLIKQMLDKLPYELTDGQKYVLRAIFKTAKKEKEINALVQGDVGAGKTIVAAIVCAQMALEGYQSSVMAPTQILASQHYEEFKRYLEPLGVTSALLTSSTKKKERNSILKGLKSGEIKVLIGTQSILSDEIEFDGLSTLVVDEEHRFGVKQRDKIRQKSEGIHYISMSATPIPRSLALSIFGSMDVFEIKTMPKGRKPIKTYLLKEDSKAINLMRQEIASGRQVYMVSPLINESESELMAEIEDANSLLQRVKSLGFNAEVATGDMKDSEVDDILNRFKNKEFDVLVSTTIIEVGVNNPNATVMVIENAERFGLSQLHQLRGRVGRGEHQSYCILVSAKDTERLHVLTTTNDGFVISQEDLRLRGAGNLIGTEQSGYAEEFELILSNPDYNNKIRLEVEEILKNHNRKSYYKDELKKLIN